VIGASPHAAGIARELHAWRSGGGWLVQTG
jgi:hypothetical protein